jgi:predicted CoA-binding protein
MQTTTVYVVGCQFTEHYLDESKTHYDVVKVFYDRKQAEQFVSDSEKTDNKSFLEQTGYSRPEYEIYETTIQ